MPTKEPHREAERIERDADPQFAPTRKGSENDGVSNAEPRVITGDEDATFHKDTEKKYPRRPS